MRSGFHEEPSSADADLSVEEESMHNMFEEFYQKSYGFEAVFPPSSVDRLPFHVFLLDGEDIVKKYLQPIIFHEINIFNVLVRKFFCADRWADWCRCFLGKLMD